jgi:stearoyl-CoA desaturase (delta-9 desaturase)
LIIGGEELHNNHHTTRPSAKLSVKPYEFDIGWPTSAASRCSAWRRCARPRRSSKLGAVKPVADDKTLEAIIANRYEVMAKYARSLRRASRAEVARLKGEGAASSAKLRRCSPRAAGCTATTTRSRTP